MMLKNNKQNWLTLFTFPGTKKNGRELFYPVEIVFYFTIQKVKYFPNNQFNENMVSSFHSSFFVFFSKIKIILKIRFHLEVDSLNEKRFPLNIICNKNGSLVHGLPC